MCMDSHYVVERGVAFEAHTQLKINDGVTLYKLFIKKFIAQMQKWSRYVYNNQDFFVLFFENIKFLHILWILEMKKWGCRQSWVIIFLGVPPSRVAKGGGPHNYLFFILKLNTIIGRIKLKVFSFELVKLK